MGEVMVVKKRRVPLRMCVGCREMKPKKELIRVVRTPEGNVEIDRTGKRSGRGAYICSNRDCLDLAVKARSLEKALDQNLSPEVLAALRGELEQGTNRRVGPDGPKAGPAGRSGVMG